MQAHELTPKILTQLAESVLEPSDAALKTLEKVEGDAPWSSELEELHTARALMMRAARSAGLELERFANLPDRATPGGGAHELGTGSNPNRGVPNRARRIRDAQNALRKVRSGNVSDQELEALRGLVNPGTYRNLRFERDREIDARIALSKALRRAAAAQGGARLAVAGEAEVAIVVANDQEPPGYARSSGSGHHAGAPRDLEKLIHRAELDAARRTDVVLGAAAWRQLADAIIDSKEGYIFLGGDPTPDAVAQSNQALRAFVAEAGQGGLLWIDTGEGSWWGRFRTAVGSRFQENDLDTLKRAAEVQLLDRHESQSALNYASAVQQLAAAAEGCDHVFLQSKNVLLVKTVLSDGRSVMASRVLTPAEVLALTAGELTATLREADSAYLFVLDGTRTGRGAIEPH